MTSQQIRDAAGKERKESLGDMIGRLCHEHHIAEYEKTPLRACERAVVEAAVRLNDVWENAASLRDYPSAVKETQDELHAAVAAWREAKRGA